jgi:hypothetical protein
MWRAVKAGEAWGHTQPLPEHTTYHLEEWKYVEEDSGSEDQLGTRSRVGYLCLTVEIGNGSGGSYEYGPTRIKIWLPRRTRMGARNSTTPLRTVTGTAAVCPVRPRTPRSTVRRSHQYHAQGRHPNKRAIHLQALYRALGVVLHRRSRPQRAAEPEPLVRDGDPPRAKRVVRHRHEASRTPARDLGEVRQGQQRDDSRGRSARRDHRV